MDSISLEEHNIYIVDIENNAQIRYSFWSIYVEQ